MICPRCEAELKYGAPECPECGLKFKYRETDVNSKCKRSTAAVLCFLTGYAGIHNFYLGYAVKGIIRLALFLLFLGFFVSPQILNLIDYGMFRMTFDYYGVFGLFTFLVMVISFVISVIEFVHLMLGQTECDAKGLKLR